MRNKEVAQYFRFGQEAYGSNFASIEHKSFTELRSYYTTVGLYFPDKCIKIKAYERFSATTSKQLYYVPCIKVFGMFEKGYTIKNKGDVRRSFRNFEKKVLDFIKYINEKGKQTKRFNKKDKETVRCIFTSYEIFQECFDIKSTTKVWNAFCSSLVEKNIVQYPIQHVY